MKHVFSLLMLGLTLSGLAQSRTRIVDSQTGEPLAYANVTIGSENLISNEEGYLSVPDAANENATVSITYLGFAPLQTTVAELRSKAEIKLQEGHFELDDVDVNKVKPNAENIMAEVKKNLQANYGTKPEAAKDVVFLRTSRGFKPKDISYDLTKSTGFNKKQLAEVNKELADIRAAARASSNKVYTDVLGDFYSGKANKFSVVKAVRLIDEERAGSMEELQDRATKVIVKHLDPTKYYKLRSGMIPLGDSIKLGDQVSVGGRGGKKVEKTPEETAVKNSLEEIYKETNLWNSPHLDFASDLNAYEYIYDGATYSSNGDLLYVIKFQPRKGRANYEGKMYINDGDFAVVRTEYKLASGKRLEGVNVKMLLGIKISHNVSQGTLLFRKDPLTNGYYLSYASRQEGQYFYLHRPLKFKEMTDEDRDVVAFDILAEGDMLTRTDFLDISRSASSADAVAGASEKDFEYTKVKKYDPALFSQYGVEPLEEMRKFSVE